MLVQTSSIDSAPTGLHGIDAGDPQDADALEAWRALMLQELTAVEWLFSGGTSYRTVLQSDDRWNMGPEGQTFRDVLTRYWEGGIPERVIFGNPGEDVS